jgi:hypothetical protein
MLLLWFSHDTECIDIVDKINENLFNIPDELVYCYLYDAVPQKRRFIKWDKGIKNKDLLKKERKIIDDLKETYGFSEYEAKKLYVLYIKR